VSEHVYVIPDGRVNLVPNIGIIVGTRATLVVDAGMGPRNGQVVMRELAKSAKILKYILLRLISTGARHGRSGIPPSTIVIRTKVQQEKWIENSPNIFTILVNGLRKLERYCRSQTSCVRYRFRR